MVRGDLPRKEPSLVVSGAMKGPALPPLPQQQEARTGGESRRELTVVGHSRVLSKRSLHAQLRDGIEALPLRIGDWRTTDCHCVESSLMDPSPVSARDIVPLPAPPRRQGRSATAERRGSSPIVPALPDNEDACADAGKTQTPHPGRDPGIGDECCQSEGETHHDDQVEQEVHPIGPLRGKEP